MFIKFDTTLTGARAPRGGPASYHFIFHSFFPRTEARGAQGALRERKKSALLRNKPFICHTCAFHGLSLIHI